VEHEVPAFVRARLVAPPGEEAGEQRELEDEDERDRGLGGDEWDRGAVGHAGDVVICFTWAPYPLCLPNCISAFHAVEPTRVRPRTGARGRCDSASGETCSYLSRLMMCQPNGLFDGS
jgi:hypothetical protein